MKKYLVAILFIAAFTTGCGNLSPRANIENQGEIDELKNNQNGVMLDLLKFKAQQEILARDIKNLQQGLINQNNENYGVQILQGDGALILMFALGTIAMLLVYHYRTRAVRSEKAAGILAQQIALFNDVGLENNVFLAAMNTEVESEVYHYITKGQKAVGRD